MYQYYEMSKHKQMRIFCTGAYTLLEKKVMFGIFDV